MPTEAWMLNDIQTIAICGAGTMGLGIAQVAAQSGYQVILFDVNDDSLKKAEEQISKNLQGAVARNKLDANDVVTIKARITTTSYVKDVKADLIIEAIIEDLDIKLKLFASLNEVNSPRTIFASNTSTIPISLIAAQTEYSERVAGMHFFNPAHIMKLVEVITAKQTHESIPILLYELSKKMGKVPVHAKDAPGFIVNRVARQYYLESLKIVEEGVASPKDIDQLMEGLGFKMGPFKLMDLIGIDANNNVSKSMWELMDHEERFRPSTLQQEMVDKGLLGRKTSQGFYNYED